MTGKIETCQGKMEINGSGPNCFWSFRTNLGWSWPKSLGPKSYPGVPRGRKIEVKGYGKLAETATQKEAGRKQSRASNCGETT